MKYRAEIDGLRALAVIPVILFHAGITFFSGGFVGVDIFFVISGYLITTIIYDEIKEQRFSIVNFYERRARRILPALFFISALCIPFAWLWMLPEELKNFSQSLIAVNLFSSNIFFWKASGYFDSAAEFTPLLHTWSLAVEEQFYIFFPLVLLFFRRLRENWLIILIGSMVVASLAIAEYGAKHHPTANFYLLPTRAWELGIGALLAICTPLWQPVNQRLAQPLSIIGLLLITYAIIFFDRTVPFPSHWALIPVIGTALIIVYAHQQTWVGKLLGVKGVVGIGLISYSAYLWHQPLFAFARIKMIDNSTIYLLLAGLALLFAYLSWRFIEQPFRSKTRYNRNNIFLGSFIFSALFISLGLIGSLNNGFQQRYTQEDNLLLRFLKYDRIAIYRQNVCFLNLEQSFYAFENTCYSAHHTSQSLFLWGDSHAAALSFGIRQLHLDTTQLTIAGCPPFMAYQSQVQPHCSEVNQFILDKLTSDKPEIVLLHANWLESYLLNDQLLAQYLEHTIKQIKEKSPASTIVVLGGVPQWQPSLPAILVRSKSGLEPSSYSKPSQLKELRAADRLLAQVSKSNNIPFISLLHRYCTHDSCLSVTQYQGKNEPFAWDYGHLTRSSSLLLSRHVLDNIIHTTGHAQQ